jgi:hypothetical protein
VADAELGQVAYAAEEPRHFQSRPGINRPFCPHCGSRIGYTDARMARRIDFYAGGRYW